MANVENKTAAVPPVESQQASRTVAAAEVTQSQAQAATGPAEVSVAVEQAAVPDEVTDKGLERTLPLGLRRSKSGGGSDHPLKRK